jgi:DNA-binding Lrp family transcriptional regulator
MSTGFLFDGLKMHLKARGMTYADVAKALKLSEATVKRIFATRNCDLARLEELCQLVQVDVAELARGMPRESRLINRLSLEQEEALMSEPRLLLIAVCATHLLRVEEICQLYSISEQECVQLLLRLEKAGILELHENNRIRLLLSRTFTWIPDGPIMRYAKSQAPDFFDHPFSKPGELMHIMSVRVSREGQMLLLRKMEQLAREYAEQHAADAKLPLDDRPHISVLMAVRTWEPTMFKSLRRQPG